MFPRTENQPRSRFLREGTETLGGRRVMIVRVEEREKPRRIGTPD
jgi:hypothetical protein